jgi:ribosomal L20-like protein
MYSSKPIFRIINHSFSPPSTSIFTKPTNHQRIQLFSSTRTNHEATSRRLRRRLAMPQAPSMRTRNTPGPKTSHIIFNPPPASPNVYHTPLKFLPPNDVRRKLYESGPSLYNLPRNAAGADVGRYSHIADDETQHPAPFARPGTALHEIGSTFPIALSPRLPDDAPLPPALHYNSYTKPLTQEQVEEIRTLRTTKPFEWTVAKLAKKYGCTQQLVKAIAISPKAHQKYVKRLERTKGKWNERRTLAKRDRARREVLWGMDA